MNKLRVLFVCTHNSARSQMAEGMLRAWAGDDFEVASAGTEQTFVRLEAIDVMAEIGIDIGGQQSKSLEPFLDEEIDWLITVCDQARESCPTLPGVEQQAHWSIDDPVAASQTDEDPLTPFRHAREELAIGVRRFIEEHR